MRSGFLIAALCIAGAVADTELSNPKIARRAYNFEPLEKYRQLCVDQCFDGMKKYNGVPDENNDLLTLYCRKWCLSLKLPPVAWEIKALCEENLKWRWLLRPQRQSDQS